MNLRELIDAFQAASPDEQLEFAELVVDTVAEHDGMPDYVMSPAMRSALEIDRNKQTRLRVVRDGCAGV